MDTVAGASSMLEASRDLTLDAVQAAAARTFGSSSTKDVSVNQVKKLLDSRFDQEIHEGLRKTVNMMYKGQQCLPLFSAVIKNVASPNVEIKKLVYIYLLKYAEQEPDLALLSINTIQKSLSDQNPQVRAMALRVMSSIQVTIISQIVSLAIKKGCGDMSAVVRKAAALAIPKCYRLEKSTEPQMIDYISQLLGDKQYYVVGSAIAAFLEVCPDRTDLLHKHYRSLVKKLVDMDEWGQLALIKLLTIYSRRCFKKPHTYKECTEGESNSTSDPSTEARSEDLDPDLKLFLEACKSLFKNRNPAVILAVARAFVYVGTPTYVQSVAPSLVALLRAPQETHETVLYNIVSICIDYPAYFAPFADHFWIWSTDNAAVRRLKMELLTLIFPQCEGSTKGIILSELEHFTTSSDPSTVRDSVRAIGRCAQNDTSTVSWCMNLLLQQTSSPDDVLVGEALVVVRYLIQNDPRQHKKTIIKLAKNLDSIHDTQARATIVWLISEYATDAEEQNSIAPDVLRILLKGFAQEDTSVKAQILLLAARVYLHYMNSENRDVKTPEQDGVNENADGFGESQADEQLNGWNGKPKSENDHPVAALWEYVQLLVRYDSSYELRDRARLYKNLLADPATIQLASLVLLAPKPVPHVPSPSETRKDLMLGSTTLIVGQDAGPSGLPGYEILPDWTDPGQLPDPDLRDAGGPLDDGQGKMSAASTLDSASSRKTVEVAPKPRVPVKSLDDWLDEEDKSPAVHKQSTAKAAFLDDDDDDSSDDDDDDDDEDEEESDGESDDESEDESESDDEDDDEDEGSDDELIRRR